jgi:Sulfotransferase family
MSDPKNRRRVVEEYLALRRLRFLTDPIGLAEKLMREGTSYRALFTCLVKHHAESQGKQRWGEKTPQHALFSTTLCDWYPGATLIHMIRDPRDVVASLQRMSWAANSVVQNAWTWRRCNLAAERCSHLPQYLPVRYETLVSQPERELRRICERIGEEYVPCMLDPRQPTGFSSTRPWSLRAQQPITTERLDKWREELTANEVSQIEWAVGRHMETFGYQRSMDPPSSLTIASGLGFAVLDAVRTRLPLLPGIFYRLVRPTQLKKQESRMRRREMKNGQMPGPAQ